MAKTLYDECDLRRRWHVRNTLSSFPSRKAIDICQAHRSLSCNSSVIKRTPLGFGDFTSVMGIMDP
jgi:hypothetical protein